MHQIFYTITLPPPLPLYFFITAFLAPLRGTQLAVIPHQSQHTTPVLARASETTPPATVPKASPPAVRSAPSNAVEYAVAKVDDLINYARKVRIKDSHTQSCLSSSLDLSSPFLTQGFLVAHDLWTCVLCCRDDARGRGQVRLGPLWGGVPGQPQTERCHDSRRHPHQQDGSSPSQGLRPDARAKMGDLNGKVRILHANMYVLNLSLPPSAVPMVVVIITTRIQWYEVVTGSFQWMCTFLAALPLQRHCSMASCSSRRRSKGPKLCKCGTESDKSYFRPTFLFLVTYHCTVIYTLHRQRLEREMMTLMS